MKRVLLLIFAPITIFSCTKEQLLNDAHIQTNVKVHPLSSSNNITYYPKVFHWVQTSIDSCTGATVFIDGYIDAVNVSVMINNTSRYAWKYRASFKAEGSDGTTYSVKFLQNESGIVYYDTGNETYSSIAKTVFTSDHSSFLATTTINIEINPSEGINAYFSDFSSAWTCKNQNNESN